MRLSGGLMKSEDRESMPSIAINTFYKDKYDKIYYDLGEPFFLDLHRKEGNSQVFIPTIIQVFNGSQ